MEDDTNIYVCMYGRLGRLLCDAEDDGGGLEIVLRGVAGPGRPPTPGSLILVRK
ncbi:hypothetical protein Hanom_Chr15g01360451 [Helianthus anomalus]